MAFLNFGKKKLDDKHSRDNAPANDDALDNVESNDNTSGDETKNIKEVDDVENNTALSDDDAEVLLEFHTGAFLKEVNRILQMVHLVRIDVLLML